MIVTLSVFPGEDILSGYEKGFVTNVFDDVRRPGKVSERGFFYVVADFEKDMVDDLILNKYVVNYRGKMSSHSRSVIEDPSQISPFKHPVKDGVFDGKRLIDTSWLVELPDRLHHQRPLEVA